MRTAFGRGEKVLRNRIEIVPAARPGMSLLLAGLFGGFGDLAGGGVLLGDGFDDAHGDRLPHVADGEAAERRILGESFDAHGLGRRHFYDGGVAVFDGFGESFQFFAGTTIALLQDLFKLASDVGGMAIHDWCITILDFSRMVENNDLSIEVFTLLGWVAL